MAMTNIQLGFLFACGLLVVITEGRFFVKNPFVCDLHVEINQVSKICGN